MVKIFSEPNSAHHVEKLNYLARCPRLGITLAVATLLAACATGPQFPGETKMNEFRAQDGATTWNNVVWLDKENFPGCDSYALLDTELISYDEPIVFNGGMAEKGRFSEIWTYDRCGTFVKRQIDFEIESTERVRQSISAPL